MVASCANTAEKTTLEWPLIPALASFSCLAAALVIAMGHAAHSYPQRCWCAELVNACILLAVPGLLSGPLRYWGDRRRTRRGATGSRSGAREPAGSTIACFGRTPTFTAWGGPVLALVPWLALLCMGALGYAHALLPAHGADLTGWRTLPAATGLVLATLALCCLLDAYLGPSVLVMKGGLVVRQGRRRCYHAWSDIETLDRRRGCWVICSRRGAFALAGCGWNTDHAAAAVASALMAYP
jgi:hypothetical protein